MTYLVIVPQKHAVGKQTVEGAVRETIICLFTNIDDVPLKLLLALCLNKTWTYTPLSCEEYRVISISFWVANIHSSVILANTEFLLSFEGRHYHANEFLAIAAVIPS